MSKYLSKLFQDSTQNQEKDLPQGFAEKILQYDITFMLSNFTNLDALNKLVQLYMKGVEYYESVQDRKQEYFKYKLHWLMSHPNLLQDKQSKVELHYPQIKGTTVTDNQEKVQVQQLIQNMHQDERIINKIIKNDIQGQEQRINSRLRQRSTSKNEREVQTKPNFYNPYTFSEHQSQFKPQPKIVEVYPEEEQSQVYSKRISPQK